MTFASMVIPLVVVDSSADRKSKYTWIAVKRQGQWRVISETFTNVAAAK